MRYKALSSVKKKTKKKKCILKKRKKNAYSMYNQYVHSKVKKRMKYISCTISSLSLHNTADPLMEDHTNERPPISSDPFVSNHSFSSLSRTLGDGLKIHSPPALYYYFLEVEISSCTPIPLFMPG